jgi:hypothetical protein
MMMEGVIFTGRFLRERGRNKMTNYASPHKDKCKVCKKTIYFSVKFGKFTHKCKAKKPGIVI